MDMPHFRLTIVERAKNPGDPRIVKDDRLEFVDADGKVTDVSRAMSKADVLSRVGHVRVLQIEILQFTIETQLHEEV